MVTKICNSCFPEFSPQHVHRHNFYLCQWQRNTQVRIIYLFYRWITAITFLAVLVCSLLDIGYSEVQFENHYSKWWIYLTNWGLLACTSQAWLAAWIVTQGMMVERDDFELMRQAKKSRLHRLYWVLYTIATVYSFIITICYWALVYNPDINKINALNLMVHVFNSVIMLIDLAIVGHPIKLSHAYWTTGIGVVYAIFSGIYFLAGGTDRRNNTTIYPVLDWKKPGKTIVVTACGILFVFVIHAGVYCLYRVRICIFTQLCVRHSNQHDSEMGEHLNPEQGQQYQHQQQQTQVFQPRQQPKPPQQQPHQPQPHHQPQPSQPYVYQDNNKPDKMTSLSRTVSALEAGQREQFLNPNTIVELKM